MRGRGGPRLPALEFDAYAPLHEAWREYVAAALRGLQPAEAAVMEIARADRYYSSQQVL